jgi:peptidoglycan/LPS O-acetylase OafA/YrhL
VRPEARLFASAVSVERRGNFDGLTALRGVAAYLVVFSHCRRLVESSYFGEPAYPSVLRFLDAGTFGVVLFFVLSGCTLHLNYGGQLTTPESLSRFVIRRFFRVYPAFLVSVFVYALLDALVGHAVGFPDSGWTSTFGKAPDARIVAEYLSFSFNFFGAWDYLNNAYWSLPVEFQFYLLFPAFIVLLRVHPLALIAGALVLFAATSALRLQFLTFYLAWQFAGGILVAWFLPRIQLRLPNPIVLLAAGLLILAGMALSLLHKRLYYPPGVSDWTYLGALAFPIVYLTARMTAPASRIGNSVFRFLVRQGESSYSAYLYHNAFVVLAYMLIVQFRLIGSLREATVYPLVLTGTYLASHLSFRFVERPGIVLGRRISGAIGRRRATA